MEGHLISLVRNYREGKKKKKKKIAGPPSMLYVHSRHELPLLPVMV